MAKGFMIFLEDAKPPKLMHKTWDSAYREAKRLSKKYRGRKVMLLEYHVTLLSEVKDENANAGSQCTS